MRRFVKSAAILSMAILCAGSLAVATACASEDAPTYIVAYIAGAEDATGAAPAREAYTEGTTIMLKPATIFEREGYKFEAWSDGTTTYSAGASFTMPAGDVTFTAVWTELES